MKYQLLLMALVVLVGASKVMAQANKLPAAVNVPTMAFDQRLTEQAIVIDSDYIPSHLRINSAVIVLGSTTLTEITDVFKTGIPLYNGKGYYQCYSLPRYSHQLWFVTKGTDLTQPVTEVVMKLGNTLPTEYCPLITAASYPTFSNKMRLQLKPDLVESLFGKPLQKQGATSVYLVQLPRLQKLKIQTQAGSKGVQLIKITQEGLAYQVN
ncbi:hypothetical protein [Entomomonas asaccharolytica]|uniref:Uncharacterized protein n=1 Tax=Entomomonas asaccharolytica TaxID=2785331 RepID=A0A974NDS5_9GAMM|nr:hypothetical protein [Entomomonas asaccharolytica]QQP84823.1 hypothetical protein JHT90_10475 [Entomomonas asaccharolytica]